ncbi:MAG: transferase hexapeptide repeat family protein [Saprospiraceae bacterium]
MRSDMVYRYKQYTPYIHPEAFVHPLACVTGCVRIGAKVYVGPYAVLRGDFGEIIIEDGCNIQEHCMIHMFPGVTVHLKENVHVGHGAIIHGAEIGQNCLIGMNSVIMDHVIIGAECIVGAMTFIKEGEIYSIKQLIAGNPARVIRDVSDEMISWKSKGTALYQQLAEDMRKDFSLAEPLRQIPEDWQVPNGAYASWNKTKK